MTQEQRRIFLITELLKENDRAVEANFGYSNATGTDKIPTDEKSQSALLRALMNIREPREISTEILAVQDEYLQELSRERGITDLFNLKPVKTFYPQNNNSAGYEFYLWQGDITTLKVDAIVNAANSQLLGCFSPLHSCIDNCIHTYAGIQLRLACNKIMQEQGYPEPTGSAKITHAFNLPIKFVLHTVGPIINAKSGAVSVTNDEQNLLANCYKNCLKKASEQNLTSIAFCCISTGVFCFPSKLAAVIAVKTVKDWLNKNTSSVKKIVFNVFEDSDLEIYKEICASH